MNMFRIFSLLLCAAAGLYYVSFSASTAAPTATAPVAASTEQLQQRQQQLSQQLLQQLDQQLPSPAPSASPAEQLLGHARRLHQSSDHISGQQIQRQTLAELSRQPAQLELASQILTDLNFAEQQFGAEQALSRLYAIKLLEETARLGNIQPLAQTILQLTTVLEVQTQQGQPFQKAQDQDLADLLRIRLKYLSHHPAADNLDLIVAELGFQPELGRAVSKIYGLALYDMLEAEYGIEKAQQLAKAAVAFERFDKR